MTSAFHQQAKNPAAMNTIDQMIRRRSSSWCSRKLMLAMCSRPVAGGAGSTSSSGIVSVGFVVGVQLGVNRRAARSGGGQLAHRALRRGRRRPDAVGFLVLDFPDFLLELRLELV